MSTPINTLARDSDPYVVAEIGCNHMGRMSVANELIQKAAEFCQIPCVKFQKRCVRETLTPEEYDRPHPVPDNSYGKSYGEHRDNLEFSLDQHRELMDYCTEWKIAYSCSVWDLTSARDIISLQPEFLKIP